MTESHRPIESTASTLAISLIANGRYHTDIAGHRKPVAITLDRVDLHLNVGIAFRNPTERRYQ
jgi:hypothetical protein